MLELEGGLHLFRIHLYLFSQELSLVMVLLANILNSIARNVNTPIYSFARQWSMT